MTIYDKIKDEKTQYSIKREFINMNILQVQKCCHLIKVEKNNELSLYFLEKYLQSK